MAHFEAHTAALVERCKAPVANKRRALRQMCIGNDEWQLRRDHIGSCGWNLRNLKRECISRIEYYSVDHTMAGGLDSADAGEDRIDDACASDEGNALDTGRQKNPEQIRNGASAV